MALNSHRVITHATSDNLCYVLNQLLRDIQASLIARMQIYQEILSRYNHVKNKERPLMGDMINEFDKDEWKW